ncbi:MAG: chromosome segregation SMC family protein, partial [Oscillospiraceae bacterium]
RFLMFFKSLEIHGFKSFADKTVLNFDAQTTAVVGSNGNGKSNISDALRWVMGEQGAKTLRGEKMEDVIFHGTVERKPMGFARVALTMDNKDRALKIDADEVVISRKLYRSGESEYLINGKRVRLKDIQELLMGTGLGRDGYSIIGQNRVRDIVNARAQQRREFFEEAAGVSLALHQKASAEKNLAAAEENITRQRDILSMYEERLPTLKKQSEKAILFTELQTERRALEISVSIAKLSEQRAAMEKLNDELLLNRGYCDNFESDVNRAQEEIESVSDEKLSAQASLEHQRRSKEAANAVLADKRMEIAVAEAELTHNAGRRNELSEQIKTAEQGSRGFDEQIEALNAEITEMESAVADCDTRAAQAQNEFDALSAQSSDADKQFSELEAKLSEMYREKTAAGLAASQAEFSMGEAQAQKQEFLEGLSDSETKLSQYNSEKASDEQQLRDNTERSDGLRNKLAGYQRITEGKRRRMEEAKRTLDEVNAKLIEKQQRHKVLSDLEKNMVGYSNAVKAVMNAFDEGRLKGIHGIVADILTVQPRHVQAIETVLQGTMQNIIVDDGETATRCIAFLKETNAGRATFYPLATMRGRVLGERGVTDEDGVEGIASELVQCDDTYIEIVRNLLGNTVVVDDMSTANRIAKKYGYKFRIVTLDGQQINPGGSYTGGSRAD